MQLARAGRRRGRQGGNGQDVRAGGRPGGVAAGRPPGARRRRRPPRRPRADVGRRHRSDQHRRAAARPPQRPAAPEVVRAGGRRGRHGPDPAARRAARARRTRGRQAGPRRRSPPAARRSRPAAPSAPSSRRGLAVELVHNQRQAELWERRALDHVADGRAAEAVSAYQQHGRIHTAPTPDQTRARLVEDWWQAAQTGEDAIILAHRRTDVAELNQLARNAMRAAGRLRGPQLELPGGAFAAGDLVVIKRNDHQHGVTNGDRGHDHPGRPRPPAADRSRSTTAKSSSAPASCTTPPARAARRSSTATRSPATSPKASPPTPPSCSPTPACPRSSPTPRSPAAARPTTSTSPNNPTRRTPNTRPSSRPATRSRASPPCWPPAAPSSSASSSTRPPPCDEAEERLRRARRAPRHREHPAGRRSGDTGWPPRNAARPTPPRNSRARNAHARNIGTAHDRSSPQHDLDEQHAKHLERVTERLEATRARDLDRGRGLGR